MIRVKISIQITYLRAIHVLRQTEDIDMPAIMERVCVEVVEGVPGKFNWEVLDELAPENDDEMEELNALLTSWVPSEPTHQSKDKGKGKPKGKGKAAVENVKVESGLDAGKAKSRSRGQKRKAEVSGEEGKEATVNPEEVTNVRGKKARTKSAQSSREPASAHDDEDEDDYDLEAMGVKITLAVPRRQVPCDQCARRGVECKSEQAIRGQSCDPCRGKKSACSNVTKGPMNANRLTSESLPKEKQSTSSTTVPSVETKVKPARVTSKPQEAGTSKAKAADPAGSSKPIPQAAFVLVPDSKTTVYANPKFSGPNPIEEKTTGETVLSGDGQQAIVRVTRATQRLLDSSKGDDTREGSVRPGHDGETPRKCVISFLKFLSEYRVGTTFAELRAESGTPVDVRDPFTRRLDSLSSSDERHSRDLGSLTNKLRTVHAKVEAMGAISMRQKDQEIDELRRELDVYKSLVVDLTEKQAKFEDALQLLRESLLEDSKAGKASDKYVSPEKLEAVTQELHSRVGTFIKTVNSNLRLNDSDGLSNFPGELDGLQGRLAGLEEDVRNVRRGREYTEERLGKVEGVCLTVLSNVLGESKADAIRYFRSTSNFPGKVDAGPVKKISTGAGPGPEGDDSDGQAEQDQKVQEKSKVEGVVHSGNSGVVGEDTRNIGNPEDREQQVTPDFVPSLDDVPYTFTTTDGSPVERSTRQLE